MFLRQSGQGLVCWLRLLLLKKFPNWVAVWNTVCFDNKSSKFAKKKVKFLLFQSNQPVENKKTEVAAFLFSFLFSWQAWEKEFSSVCLFCVWKQNTEWKSTTFFFCPKQNNFVKWKKKKRKIQLLTFVFEH